MSDSETRAEVDAFVALPRAERKAKYETLEKGVKLRVRKVIEARRGIAYRSEGGVPVLTQGEYIRQLVNGRTLQLRDEARQVAMAANLVELKAQLLENYGEAALQEAEATLCALDTNS